jgi:hypothetical protein
MAASRGLGDALHRHEASSDAGTDSTFAEDSHRATTVAGFQGNPLTITKTSTQLKADMCGPGAVQRRDRLPSYEQEYYHTSWSDRSA